MVGEAGEVGAVFLRKECFEVGTAGGGVELERVIRASGEKVFARGVEVEGCHICFGFGEFEELVAGL